MKPILFVVLMLAAQSSVFAKEHKKVDDSAMDPKKAEMMKAWQAYATPGEQHKFLAKMAGKWKYTSKWWESADAVPHESKGTSTMKMIIGGRFLHQEVKGTAMGMPFEGVGMAGYDNLTKKFTSTWADNMGTGMMVGHGTLDVETQTLKDSGKMTCPMTKEKDHLVDYRSEWKVVDNNTMTFTMWGPSMTDGKEIKNMEMTYKRVK